ncbi:MAG: PDZ domain-containing protein [Planctomycetes bacterium]|nr:PDZ domain-containing protein [Planctomycetota bacterium]
MSRLRGVLTFIVVAMLEGARGVAAEPTHAEEAAFRAAVSQVAAAVVRIEPVAGAAVAGAAGEEAGVASGPSTGLVIDPAGLVFATSFAVPDTAREAVVVLPDGRRVAAKPLGRDEPRGIVLLKTEAIPTACAVEPAPRRSLLPGQWTIAVGRGWSAAEPSVAVGILSAVDRGWGLAVQTDAAVSPMNYGGPLVDIAGRVIGIVAPLPAEPAQMMRGTELYDAGIGFAVPLEDLLAVLPRLAAGESLAGGILGIGYRSRDAINGDPVIASVRQGSPAARAGLRPGDRIVAVDGRPVRRVADARHAVAPRHAGDTIDVEVDRRRGGETIRIAARPSLTATLPPWRRAILGVVVAAGDDQEDDAPARIDWVLPGGPADRAGIAAGASVASIALLGEAQPLAAQPGAAQPGDDAVEAPSAAALAGVVAGLEPGQSVRLGVRRGDQVTTTDIVLDEMIQQVPDEPPPPRAVAGPGGGADAVRVSRLGGADVALPPLVVIPPGRGPVPVLIWFGLPHGAADEAEAAPWKAAAAAAGVAVILPGSRERREWSADDIGGVARAIESLNALRPVDTTRVAVAGRGPGGAFAWLLAERLGTGCRGVAVLDAPLPARFTITDAEPGTAKWMLLGGGDDAAARRRATDSDRLARAGHAVGTLTESADGGPPTALLCRWAAALGLL